MNRLDVRVLTDATEKRRVVIFRHCSGCYAFEEQVFLEAPDFRWIAAASASASFDTEEQAIAAAHRLVKWLARETDR